MRHGDRERDFSDDLLITFRNLILFFCVFVTLFANSLHAQEARISRSKMKRALLKQDREITSTTPYRLSLESSVTDIFNSSSSETLYDELTLQQLRLLKERALPIWKSDDADPVRMQRVTEKALSMRLLESVSNQLMESDLRDSFEALRSYFRSLNDFLRYSVQSDGDSLSVTSKNRGKKWIEFRPEINLRQGIDPQIRIGERLRFRYDYLDKRPYLEFSLDF